MTVWTLAQAVAEVLRALGIAEKQRVAESTQLIRLYDNNLTFKGFASPTNQPNDTDEGGAWLVIESGTINGVESVAGQIMIRTDSAYVVEDASTVLPSEFKDIPDYAHIFGMLEGVFTAGIRETGEWDIVYLISQAIKTDKITINDGAELSSADYPDISIWKDGSGKVIAWIDSSGVFHIPHLSLGGADITGEAFSALQEKIDQLSIQLRATTAMLPLFDMVEPRLVKNKDRDILSGMAFQGEFTKGADNPNPFTAVTFIDDDSIDRFVLEQNPYPSVEAYPGGYYSRMYPVFASRGVTGCEAVWGEKIGLHDDDLNPNYHCHKMLKDKYGWEMVNHTLSHRFGHSWIVEDFAEANAAGLNTGSTTPTSANQIYIIAENKNYSWDGSEWVETPEDIIEPYLRELGESENHSDHPLFNMERQYRFNQIQLEKNGLGAVESFVTPGGANSKIKRDSVRTTHRQFISGGGGFGDIYLRPPLTSAIKRFSLDISNSDDGVKNGTEGRNLQAWKDAVDQAQATGTSLQLRLHIYRTYWDNENESVEDYNANWHIPVVDPNDTLEGLDQPKAATGLTDWKDWEPIAGTRLHDLWELIGYIQSKNIPILTMSEFLNRMQNLIDLGDYTANEKPPKAPFDDTKYPHYVVGIDGSARYFKP